MSQCNSYSHIIDSGFYSGGYTTNEARKLFCDKYRYQRWVDVEAALALSQAELGLIPEYAAKAIADNAQLHKLDLQAIRRGVQETSHSLIPLLEALRKVCPGDSGQFIHFGATTQDIQDTAQSLEMKDVLAIVERDLLIIIKLLINQAIKYSDIVIIGRTHAQHALPMTLGLKIAVWIDELWRNYERLQSTRKRVLVSQLFGGVGTMDAFADKGLELLELFSNKLGLGAPLTAWHASRDRSAEYLTTLAMISGTMAKIGNEIRVLSRNEIGEMEEPFQMGKIGSSTMPHKRNPEMCEQSVVLARLIKSNALLGIEGLINDHERDYRTVRMEWVTITDSSLYICGQLSIMKDLIEGLIVYDERIKENVNKAATLISTEALMFFLGKKIGKQTAHKIVYDTSMEAIETQQPLIDLLMNHPQITGKFNRDDLKSVIDPGNHVGISKKLTDKTIDYVNGMIQQIKPPNDSELQCPLYGEEECCDIKY